MLTLPLRLVPTGRPERAAVAWLLPGDDPAAWLDELCAWETPQSSLRLHIVPCGLLVTGADGKAPRPAPLVLPLGCVANCLLLPLDARLDPPLEDAELRGLFKGERWYLFLPTAGLIEYDPADVLRLGDLVRLGSARSSGWHAAVAAEPFNDRLLSIEAGAPPSVEEIWTAARDDIGADGDQPNQLPPTPDEVRSQGQSAASRALARVVKWFTGKAPRTASKRTWVNKLDDWANRQLEKIAGNRLRELARLLHLLETDPDRGLRHALPLGGQGHRGLGQPGDHLGEHDVDFNLDRLGSGRPADPWHVSAEQQRRLRELYHQLAARELRLGRFRRAAYVYAELLGDLPAAVAALKQGKHWREAAVVLEHRLTRPLEAAECLENGGLWTEALALYERFGYFEKTGDLHARLGQPGEAEYFWSKAQLKLEGSGDFLGAARIAEEKLRWPVAARECLRRGWPASNQAKQCLAALFQHLGRHNDHEGAARLIADLRAEALTRDQVEIMVTDLADNVTVYHDVTLRAPMADCVRVRVAQVLAETPAPQARALLNQVARLDPADRLLERDCQRYLQQIPSRPAPTRKINKVAEVTLPNGIEWMSAVATGDVVYVAGRRAQKLVVVRGHRGGMLEFPPAPWPAASLGRGKPILAGAAVHETLILLAEPRGEPLPRLGFPWNAGAPPVVVGGAPQHAPERLGAARASGGRTWYVADDPHLQVALHDVGGELVRTMPLPPLPSSFSDAASFPLPMHATTNVAWFALGPVLLRATTQALPVLEAPAPIHHLRGSWPGATERLVAGLTQGAILIRASDHRAWVYFDRSLPAPAVAILRTGHLLAAGGQECRIYREGNGVIEVAGEITLAAPVLDVLPLATAPFFAVLTQDGRVTFYELRGEI